MSRIHNPAYVLKRQYMVQVPRKRPTCDNSFTDEKKRVWIKASDYNVGEYTMWEEQGPNTYYVWYNRDTVPEEGEVVFGKWKISSMYRVELLLRCVVELQDI